MIYISASSINNYLSCSMKHFLRVNFKEKEEATYPLRFGSLIHDTIEEEWKSYEKALKLAENKRKEYNIDVNSMKTIEDYLGTFFSQFAPYLSDDDEIEKEFRIKLEEDVTLLGRLDRITPDGLVFDWKTSNKTPPSLMTNVQFVLYEFAYRYLYNKPPASVYFASLKTGELVRYNKDRQVEKSVFTELLPTIISDIRYERYMRDGMFKYYSECKFCTFKEFCLGELASGDRIINEKRYSRTLRP